MARIVAERADTLPALAEVFREHGYEGASLSLLTAATGLGKGSLYHFFPSGKAEMAAAVLAEIDLWFESNIYAKLRLSAAPAAEIDAMFDATEAYFRSGQRVCLVGVLALGDARDRFAEAVESYFIRWVDALSQALRRAGCAEPVALAEDVVAGIQGAIVLSRALNSTEVFTRAITALRQRVKAAV